MSFNFHTPYPDTQALALSRAEKAAICRELRELMKEGYPIFNLRSAFPYLIDNSSPPLPSMRGNGAGQAVGVRAMCRGARAWCQECGYFFAAEYALVFQGKLPVIVDMLSTYLKYI